MGFWAWSEGEMVEDVTVRKLSEQNAHISSLDGEVQDIKCI